MLRVLSQLANWFTNRRIKDKFTTVYRENLFKGSVSRSGEGSDLLQTEIIRKELPSLLEELKAKTLIDSPCGDFLWMKEVDLSDVSYLGIDIVKDIIEKNQAEYGNDKRDFIEINIIKNDIPRADVILSRDCLVHLSFDHCLKVIKNFKKSGSTYLLTTTFTERTINEDLRQSFWRTLNLELPPFNFPKPLRLINENCTERDGQYSDKSLGLWHLNDINI